MDAPLRPSLRSFWYSVTLFVLFNSLFLGWVLFKPGTHKQFVIGDDIGQALGWLLATLLCFVGMRQAWLNSAVDVHAIPASRQLKRRVPLLFAIGIFCQFIGQIIYTYYDIHNLPPFPSWADVGYLSTFPFLLSGILLLPLRPFPGITRSRVMLDGFMIMTAFVTFSWYFVLGPTMLQGNETLLAKIVGSAYPFFDLVLIYCVLRITLRTDTSVLRSVVLLLSTGLIIVVITDSIYDYQTLQNTYVNGLQDLGWPVGYMLIGLAAQTLNLVHTRRTTLPTISIAHDTSAASSSEWSSLLPYAFIPAIIALIIYTWRTGTNQTLVNGVYLGGFALLGLVLLRQFFAIRETIFYNKELYRMQQELHRKNEALSIANRQLEEQATQIAASYEQQRHLNDLKDQFLLNVNHELRTPLTEMQGYLDLLREHAHTLDQTMQARFINFALHGCEELQRLISTILDAIRGTYQEKPLHIDIVPIADVVRDVLDLFEPRKAQEYSLQLDIPETLAVRADREYVHRILLNLLSNAFKYSPKETTVIISAQQYDTYAQKTEPYGPIIHDVPTSSLVTQSHNTEATDLSKSPYVCISIQDAGPGIPPTEIPLLFEKFVRLKRDIAGSVRGTGLGLYICKQMVTALEGRIWVESSGKKGEGSRFCFILPIASYALTKEEQASPPSVIMDAIQ